VQSLSAAAATRTLGAYSLERPRRSVSVGPGPSPSPLPPLQPRHRPRHQAPQCAAAGTRRRRRYVASPSTTTPPVSTPKTPLFFYASYSSVAHPRGPSEPHAGELCCAEPPPLPRAPPCTPQCPAECPSGLLEPRACPRAQPRPETATGRPDSAFSGAAPPREFVSGEFRRRPRAQPVPAVRSEVNA
jgi:hypothetical protein